MSPKQRDRICAAVQKIHATGVYPSAAAVDKELCRCSGCLNQEENCARKDEMARLGIEVKKVNKWG